MRLEPGNHKGCPVLPPGVRSHTRPEIHSLELEVGETSEMESSSSDLSPGTEIPPTHVCTAGGQGASEPTPTGDGSSSSLEV